MKNPFAGFKQKFASKQIKQLSGHAVHLLLSS